MRIKQICKCGVAFEVKSFDGASAIKAYQQWLESHVCEPYVADEKLLFEITKAPDREPPVKVEQDVAGAKE